MKLLKRSCVGWEIEVPSLWIFDLIIKARSTPTLLPVWSFPYFQRVANHVPWKWKFSLPTAYVAFTNEFHPEGVLVHLFIGSKCSSPFSYFLPWWPNWKVVGCFITNAWVPHTSSVHTDRGRLVLEIITIWFGFYHSPRRLAIISSSWSEHFDILFPYYQVIVYSYRLRATQVYTLQSLLV